ncbi:HEPN domain-containing protein [Novosphingobium sp. HR1a]|nr:HEPN domain-containing protein [Novosphingobium sp. HR1a]
MLEFVSNMQSRIETLPRRAQRDIKRATQILREDFAKATKGFKAESCSGGGILKIILFGSYAKGKQVVDPVGRYFSDYDLLVVVDKEEYTDASKYWIHAEDRIVDMLTERGWPQPLSLIIHTLDDVNRQLRLGRYFWVELVRQGIVLFEKIGFPFEKPGILTSEEAQTEAQRHFAKDFPDIDILLSTSRFQRDQAQFANDEQKRNRLRNWSVFNLHQAMERAYYCILLVFTFYSPKSHNLNFLSKRAEQQDERLIGVWKTDTKFGRRCYELLRAAYVKSRYSEHYKISDEELDWITDRIMELQELTRIICEERIAKLGGPDTAAS